MFKQKLFEKIVSRQNLWTLRQPIHHMEGTFIFVNMFDFEHE